MSGTPPLILASASPRRKDLLASIRVIPERILPADIDESPLKGELPRAHAGRLACEKAEKIRKSETDSYILAADTVVGVGRRILPKAEECETARFCLELLSGRSHRVFTGVCLISPNGRVHNRIVETRLKMKRLSTLEIKHYLETGEWDGKAGGYGIQGLAGAFISHINGSYSNVVGLPVYEVRNLLIGTGYMHV